MTKDFWKSLILWRSQMNSKAQQSKTFLQKITNTNFIIRDHRVHNICILPGVTLLDMIYRLSTTYLGTQAIELKHVLFKQPIATTEQFDRNVFVTFKPYSSYWTVVITSQKVKNNVPVDSCFDENMECQLFLRKDISTRPKLNVNEFLNSFRHQFDMNEIYDIAKQNNINHFEFMKTLGTIYQRDNEEIMKLNLSGLAEKYRKQFYAHPAFLDGSTFSGLSSILNETEYGKPRNYTPFIPFMIKRFCIYQPLPGTIYTYSKRPEISEQNLDAMPDVFSTDIVIYNESGDVLVEFEKLTAKRVREPNLITNLTAITDETEVKKQESDMNRPSMINEIEVGNVSSRKGIISYLQNEIGKILGKRPNEVNIKTGFYDLGLDSTQLLKLVKLIEDKLKEPLYPTLLFEYSTIDRLSEYLSENFETNSFQETNNNQIRQISDTDVIFFEPIWKKHHFSDVHNSSIRKINHFIILFSTLNSMASLIEYGLKDANVIGLNSPKEILPDQFEDTFIQLLELIQKHLQENSDSELLVQIVADSNEKGNYVYALGSLLKTAFLESVKIHSQILSIDQLHTHSEKTIIGLLEQEAIHFQQGCTEIHYKGQPLERYVKQLEELRLHSEKVLPYYKDNGVYVITGGLGGLGFLLANHIVGKAKVKLALIARTKSNNEKIDQLIQKGAEVLYLEADLSNKSEVSNAFENIKNTFGSITGVFHCAGILKDQFIVKKDISEIKGVFKPKVSGVWNLDNITQDEKLDFFVIFSSLSAVAGNIGQADYASANAFMDVFALDRQEKVNKGGRYGTTVTINWPLWQDGGMKIDNELEEMMFSTFGLQPLPSELGLKVLDIILSQTKNQIIVIYGDKHIIRSRMRTLTETKEENENQESSKDISMISKCDTVTKHEIDDIAIIGLAGRYPMANSIDEFYDNLKQGKDCVTGFPKDRWKQYQFAYDIEKIYTYGGFIGQIDRFDPLFFNIPPLQAEMMDPQARLFLEVAWEACEDAGFHQDRTLHYYPSSGDKSVGVFVGVFWSHYELFAAELTQRGNPMSLGITPASIPNTVSYCLNFHGPSMAVDTMCSSALTSVHLASESIRRGECNYAVAGGVNLVTHPHKYLFLKKANFLSSDGRCRSFGEGGDGYVPGEGVGAVLLTSLREAEKQGYTIYGVIKGSALNHVGKTSGLTVPDPIAQSEVIIHALRNAKIDPSSLSYIEAHGTGTSLGDPVEIQGLNRAFRNWTKNKQFCAIGSSKSNIGHLEAAAGIAGLAKVLLQFKYRELFPSLHVEKLNPYIPFKDTPFYVVDSLRQWKQPEITINRETAVYPRRAGLSSFGASGSNAFLIIEEYIPTDTKQNPIIINEITPVIIPISAQNKDRLIEYVHKLYEFLLKRKQSYELNVQSHINLVELAYTLQVGREAMGERIAFIVASVEELEDKLKEFTEGKKFINRFYQGRVERQGNSLSELTKDEDMDQIIEAWLNKRKSEKLAEFWVKGCNFDWDKLYSEIKPRRISCPTYPFAQEHYWIPVKDSEKEQPVTNFDIQRSTGQSLDQQDTDRLVLTKEWKQKNIISHTHFSAGIIILFETLATEKLANELFKNGEEIEVVHVRHDATGLKNSLDNQHIDSFKLSEEISTNFYSSRAGEMLYQEIRKRINSKNLLGVVDITAYDSDYEQTLSIESGKISLLQKLIENHRNEGFTLLQVTHILHDFQTKNTTIQGARLAGLYRMLGSEYKQISSRTMDCDLLLEHHYQLAQSIQTEFFNRYIDNLTECCYRNNLRYEPYLKVHKIHEDLQLFNYTVNDYLPGDVVLITGGTRGIGACVAELAVSQGCRNLVIIGREELPKPSEWKKILENKEMLGLNEKIIRMQSFIEQGVNVQYYNTPLTDLDGLKAMVDEIHQTAGPISGVFHCAGLMGNNPVFFKKQLSEIKSVCEPKMNGLVTLHNAIKNEPISFFVLFSSVSSIVPTLATGQSDYAMANAYMDHYAITQVGLGNTYFKAIQWPAWGDTGMAAGKVDTPAYKQTGLVPISTEVGLLFLKYIKGASYNVYLPCLAARGQIVPEQMLKAKVMPETGSVTDISGTPESIEIYTDLRPNVKRWLREIFISELKLSENQLDENKPFNEYGIDSIILAQLVQTLQVGLEKKLEPSLLLEHTTMAALTDYFIANHGESLRIKLGAKSNVNTGNTLKKVSSHLVKEESKLVDDIAIVGLSCRFPGAPTIELYWKLITQGISAIRPVSQERWQSRSSSLHYGGWLDDIDLFDSKFFNINEKDVAIMDPQARIILEESLKAVYDSGYEYKELSGERIGVYIGGRSVPNPNISAVLNAPNPILGTGQNYLATNISRFFNFRGPSLIVDTACSSGITGLILATDALQGRRIDMALVGAVSLLLTPDCHELFDARNILNKDGKFHIFDTKSSGEVLGEGAGVVVLKRLSDAIRDGNHIYGVIKAIASNNDGLTLGPGSPNINAQKQVMQDALVSGGKQVVDIGYIEVNGGGSPVVDSLEIKALTQVYLLDNLSLPPCYIGSVKPNVGHLLLASGMAGFIRCVLSVHNKQIPPFLSALEPFEHYDFSSSRVQFNRRTIEWTTLSGKTRIAAQNSFPDGGTNCHLLIEEFVPDSNYKQQYWPKKYPNMSKQRYPLPSTYSESFHSPKIVSTNKNGTDLNSILKTFEKKAEFGS